MSFDSEEFLCEDDIIIIIKENYNKYKDIFLFCEELNRYSIGIKYKLEINSQDPRGILSGSLFIKILEDFQAAVIMYKYGMSSKAKLITRSAIEALVYLKLNIENKMFYRELINSEEKQREHLLSNIIKHKDIYTKMPHSELEEEYNKLRNENSRKGNKVLRIEELANRAELYNEYYYIYKVLCTAAHINISNFEERFILKDNEISEFDCRPSMKDIIPTLYSNCHIILLAISLVKEYVEASTEEGIEEYRARLNIFKVE